MAGSRKGERRGAADPNHIRKTAAPAKARKPKPLGGVPKLGSVGLARIVNRPRVGPEQMERDVEAYFLISGKRERLPKDIMLSAARYFEETAIQYSRVLAANMQAAAQAVEPADRLVLEMAVRDAEGVVDKYVAMAADTAMKVAPYMHAKLAALITAPGNEKTNSSLLSMLMRDLDEAGKPARYIEHIPGEGAK
jgi:hypothetical protein